jgi:hypothetical protein
MPVKAQTGGRVFKTKSGTVHTLRIKKLTTPVRSFESLEWSEGKVLARVRRGG